MADKLNGIMNKWDKMWNLSSKKKKRILYFGIFTLLFWSLHIIMSEQFRAHNKSYIWYVDGYRQHYIALVYLGRYFREIATSFLSGNFTIPMFDFSIGMGEDIISVLNFYGLGDPLLLLSALVPSSATEWLYNFLAIFRVFLAGIGFSVFGFYMKRKYSYVLLGALVYCFSGYGLYASIKHPFFIMAMIFLPLLLLGLEKIIQGEKMHVFAVFVFLAALNGFYFFYMLSIALFFYAFIRVLIIKKENKIKELWTVFIKSFISYIIGVMMAAVIILPSIIGYLQSTRSDSEVEPVSLLNYSLAYYREMILGVVSPSRLTWNFISVAAIAFVAVVILCTKKNKKFKTIRIALLVGLLWMLTPFGGYVMNGFSYVSGRWYFIMSFLMSIGLVYGMPSILKMEKSDKKNCFILLFVYAVILFIGRWDILNVTGVFMLFLTVFVLYMIQEDKLPDSLTKNTKKKVAWICCFSIMSVNLIINGEMLYNKRFMNYVSQFKTKGVALKNIENTPIKYSPNRKENEFYRVDTNALPVENGCMLTGDYGTGSYFSILNSQRLQYFQEIENAAVRNTQFKVKGVDGRSMLSALASVKYYVAKEGKDEYVPYGFELKAVKNNGKYLVYENNFSLPIGYTYDQYITREAYEKMNSLERQEGELQVVILENRVNGIQEGGIDSSLKNIDYNITDSRGVEIYDDTIEVKKSNGMIKLEFNGCMNSETYVRFDDLDIGTVKEEMSEVRVHCNGMNKKMSVIAPRYNWYFGREDFLFNMGYQKEKSTSCTITFSEPGIYHLSSLKVYCQPMDNYEGMITELKDETLENVQLETNKVSGQIQVSKDKILCLSIPYSKGWSAKVDGKPVDIMKANSMYMGILLKSGTHTVELSYCTPFIKWGLIITCLGIILFMLLLVLGNRYGKTNTLDRGNV